MWTIHAKESPKVDPEIALKNIQCMQAQRGNYWKKGYVKPIKSYEWLNQEKDCWETTLINEKKL